jgi:hypothetical protein
MLRQVEDGYMGKPLTVALLPENKAVAAVLSTEHAQ